MKFRIRFRIGGRLGAASAYSLREFCVHLVERYSLTETELCTIFTLKPGESYNNEDMEVTRQEMTRQEHARQAKREHQGQRGH